MKNPVAHFEYLGGPKLEVELFYDRAPNTVRAFAALASAGVFNSFPVERVVPGKFIQPSYTEYDRDEGKIVINAELSPAPDGDTAGLLCLRGDPQALAPADFYFSLGGYNEKCVVFGKVTSGFGELCERCMPGAIKLRDIADDEERWVPARALTQKKVWVDSFGQTLPAPERRRMPKKPEAVKED